MLDKDKSGQVTIEDVASVYDTSKHPEVMEGAKTPEEVLRQFMAQWDTVEKDGVITRVRTNGGGCTQSVAPAYIRCMHDAKKSTSHVTWRRASGPDA